MAYEALDQDVVWVTVRPRVIKAPGAPKVALAEALAKDWVEFWYQPKIDLRTRNIIGVETLARVRHPLHGILGPASFLPGAHKKSLATLARRALNAALKEGTQLAAMGIRVRFAVNVPFDVITDLSIRDILRKYHSAGQQWPGIILDVPESELLDNLDELRAISAALAADGVRFAMDDFGQRLSSALDPKNRRSADKMVLDLFATLAHLKNEAIAEMKLDRKFVEDCGIDSQKATLCKLSVDLVHSMGSTAVAVGAQNAKDLRAVEEMDCDIGQGRVFGEALSVTEFRNLIRGRIAAKSGAVRDAS